MCGIRRALRANAHLTVRRREAAAPSPFGRPLRRATRRYNRHRLLFLREDLRTHPNPLTYKWGIPDLTGRRRDAALPEGAAYIFGGNARNSPTFARPSNDRAILLLWRFPAPAEPSALESVETQT